MMRTPSRWAVLVACLLFVTGRPTAAQDSGGWWPGGGEAAPQAGVPQPAYGSVPAPPALPAAQPGVGSSADAGGVLAEDDSRWMITSPFANVAWPEVKMPKFAWRPGWATGGGDAAETTRQGPLVRIRSVTQGVAKRTRTAWNNTLDKFRWNTPPKPAASEPGFFARLFSPPPTPSGPQTVPEFVAQERPGTITR